MNNTPLYLYSFTNLGEALEDTLEHFMKELQIDEELKNTFINNFYATLEETMSQFSTERAVVSGYLESYQHLTSTWKFWIKNASIMSSSVELNSKMLKIIAVESNQEKGTTQEKEFVSSKPYKKRKSR